MPSNVDCDGRVAAALSVLPAFEHWTNQPLHPQLLGALNEADSQQLMTIAVEALRHVADLPVDQLKLVS